MKTTTQCEFNDLYRDRRTRMNTDIVARLFCAAIAMYPPLAAWTMPDSLSGRMQLVEAGTSAFLFGVMVTIAALILLDVGLNSLPRCRPLLPRLSRIRDYLYLGLAFCAAFVPFSVSKVMAVDTGANYLYFIIFALASALAWCDATAKKNTK